MGSNDLWAQINKPTNRYHCCMTSYTRYGKKKHRNIDFCKILSCVGYGDTITTVVTNREAKLNQLVLKGEDRKKGRNPVPVSLGSSRTTSCQHQLLQPLGSGETYHQVVCSCQHLHSLHMGTEPHISGNQPGKGIRTIYTSKETEYRHPIDNLFCVLTLEADGARGTSLQLVVCSF